MHGCSCLFLIETVSGQWWSCPNEVNSSSALICSSGSLCAFTWQCVGLCPIKNRFLGDSGGHARVRLNYKFLYSAEARIE